LKPSASAPSSVQQNKVAGDAWRDEYAQILRDSLPSGYTVRSEVEGQIRYETPFGPRDVDLEIIDPSGKVLGGIETKAGGADRKTSQYAKDEWLRLKRGYAVTVVYQH